MENIPFGTYLRQLREANQMPLRKLAAALDIDTSTLSKIERQERQANSTMMPIIAEVFNLELREVSVRFWTEKISQDLQSEPFAEDILENLLEKVKNNFTNA